MIMIIRLSSLTPRLCTFFDPLSAQGKNVEDYMEMIIYEIRKQGNLRGPCCVNQGLGV